MNDHHHAVVFGINRYPGIRDLRHARQDAEDVITWLRSKEGGDLPANNVLDVLADPAKEPRFTVATAMPTMVHVHDALARANKRMREQLAADPGAWDASRLYVYGSGHGIAPGPGVGAVLMANVDADPSVCSYGYNVELSLYQAWYQACGVFREVLLLADCCRDREFTAPGNGPPWLHCTQPYGTTNVALGFATTYGAPAYEATADDDGRGYFTRALIDGLRGGAADPLTGRITTTSLGEYVGRAVPVLTEGKRYPQRPSIPADTANPIVLRPARGPLPALRRNVTIRFPDGFTGEVELFFGRDSTGARWSAANGPWRIKRDEGLYRVSPVGTATTTFAGDGVFDVIAKDRDVQL